MENETLPSWRHLGSSVVVDLSKTPEERLADFIAAKERQHTESMAYLNALLLSAGDEKADG